MRTTKNALILLIYIIILLITNTACSNNKVNENNEVTVRVLYSSTSAFQQDYSNLLGVQFKHVVFDIVEYEPILGQAMWKGMDYVPASSKAWDVQLFLNLIEENQPDIIFFPPQLTTDLLEENLLMDVTESLSESAIEKIDTKLKEFFLSKGEQRLYFLSNSYVPQVIIYNKDLAEQVKLDLPNEAKDWNDIAYISNAIYQLSDGEVQGFKSKYYDDAELFLHIGNDAGLSWYDPLNQQVLFNQENWKQSLDTFLQLSSNGHNSDERSGYELFVEGKLAMLLADYSTLEQLSANQTVSFNWEITDPPQSILGYTNHHNFQYFNGILSSTTQYDIVRNIWLYLNSEQLAKQKFNSSFHRMEVPVYSNILNNKDVNVEALYRIAPEGFDIQERLLSSEVMEEIKSYINERLHAIKENPIGIDNVVQTWTDELSTIIKEQ